MKTIFRTEGWRAFFRGLFPSLLGITHVAVQFPLYESLKRWSSECFRLILVPNLSSCHSHFRTLIRQRGTGGSNTLSNSWLLSRSEDDCVDRDLPSRSSAHTTADLPQADRRPGSGSRPPPPSAWHYTNGEDDRAQRRLEGAVQRSLCEPRTNGTKQCSNDGDVSVFNWTNGGDDADGDNFVPLHQLPPLSPGTRCCCDI